MFMLPMFALAVPGLGAPKCSALTRFTMPGHEVLIQQAKEIPAGAMPASPKAPPSPPQILPAHCRVDGVIDARQGRDG
jgi:hypothetical protein